MEWNIRVTEICARLVEVGQEAACKQSISNVSVNVCNVIAVMLSSVYFNFHKVNLRRDVNR